MGTRRSCEQTIARRERQRTWVLRFALSGCGAFHSPGVIVYYCGVICAPATGVAQELSSRPTACCSAIHERPLTDGIRHGRSRGIGCPAAPTRYDENYLFAAWNNSAT